MEPAGGRTATGQDGTVLSPIPRWWSRLQVHAFRLFQPLIEPQPIMAIMQTNKPSSQSPRRIVSAVAPILALMVAGSGLHDERLHTARQDSQAEPNPFVVLETSLGNITIELFPEKAPKTVENFLALVSSGFYDEMLFHRVVVDYAIQTGALGMDGLPRQHEVAPIENEAGNRMKNLRGAVAMARGEDPQSADTQFFINVRNNPGLDFKAFTRQDWGYAVFAQVVEGIDVVEAIARIDTHRVGPYRDFPAEPIALYAAYVR